VIERVKVGFAGFGEAGWYFSKGLTAANVDVLAWASGKRNRPPYSEQFLARLQDAGAEPRESLVALVADSDVVVSAVVASASRRVGEEIASLMKRGQMLVDINASAPADKIAVSERVAAAGGLYVDASVMGAVSLYKHEVPLYVSGTGAKQFREQFTPWGFKIKVANDQAGAAAIIKMLRSVALKGMASAVLEALVAAARAGVVDEAFEGICAPMEETTFTDWTIMCCLTDGIHAERRADEMAAAVDVLSGLGMDPIMTKATLARLREVAELGFKDVYSEGGPTDYREALEQYVRLAQPAPNTH